MSYPVATIAASAIRDGNTGVTTQTISVRFPGASAFAADATVVRSTTEARLTSARKTIVPGWRHIGDAAATVVSPIAAGPTPHLVVEHKFTRDHVAPLSASDPDMNEGAQYIPVPPEFDRGWVLYDTVSKDRRSGWRRIRISWSSS